MNQAFMKVGAGIFAVTALVACGSDSTAPGINAAGSYTATTFMTTGPSGQNDQLLSGSTVHITLADNGKTSGQLHIPASASNPTVDADLTGTWTQHGMTVRFSIPAVDTFINDMPFTLTANGPSAWDLVGDMGFSGTRVQLTLSRVGAV
jgi:hypothetical protein